MQKENLSENQKYAKLEDEKQSQMLIHLKRRPPRLKPKVITF